MSPHPAHRARTLTIARHCAVTAVSLLLLVAPAVGRTPSPVDLGEVTLARADPVVPVTIAGVPAMLAVLPDVGLTVSPIFGATLPIEWQRGDPLDVGRVPVRVREAEAPVMIAGITRAMTISSPDRSCCRAHDGAIGAADLPWNVVRIGRAGTMPERRYPFEAARRDGLSIPWRVGKDTIHLLLAPDNPETVATAAAAALLARTFGGHLGTPVREVPILYGIARPVRDMRFDTGAPLLGFTLDHVAVRSSDFAGAAGILADADPSQAPQAAPGDIVVRHRPPPAQYRWLAVTIGRDLLDRCPQIAIYVRTHEIGLSCDPA